MVFFHSKGKHSLDNSSIILWISCKKE